MTDTAVPPQHDAFRHDALMGSLLYQRRIGMESSQIELLPNPDFVFPLRNITPPDSAASNTTSASTGRPMSAQMPPASRRAPTGGPRQRKSVSALPNFSFNPSAPETTSPTVTTPPRSPTSPIAMTPSRAIGHRRRGSEFIGGDSRFGGAGLMSTSPTKRDAVPPPPPSEVRLGPPAGRRGHAHRRSGAISCHDLQSILQPANPNGQLRSGSAPASPMELEPKARLAQQGRRTMSQSSLRSSSLDENFSMHGGTESLPQRPPSRARVGFSERVEYIRPLSTISSGTESSMSTIRGHSVSGSLSSLNSTGAASPPSTRMARPSLDTTFEDELPRPRPTTAGEILDRKSKERCDAQQSSPTHERPRSAISQSTSEPNIGSCLLRSHSPVRRRSFFWLEQCRSESPLSSSPLSKTVSDPSLVPSEPDSPPSQSAADESEQEPSESIQEHFAQLKVTRTPRKVKSWAHSIMSRKPKSSHSKDPNNTMDASSETSPIASPFAFPSSASDNLDYFANFDVDDTVVIVTPPANDPSQPRLDMSIAAWKPRQDLSQTTETTSPVIDLDAALGPFSSLEQGSNPRPQGRGFSAARRSMHSGAFNSALFIGNGVNHRRTESAPALVPFELRNTAAIPSTMADVFEEEEEDEEEGAISRQSSNSELSAKDSEEQPLNIQEETTSPEVDVDHHDDSGVDMTQAGIAPEDGGSPVISEASIKSADAELDLSTQRSKRVDSHSSSEESTVEIVEDFEEPRASSFTKDSDSTVTPTLTAQESKEPPALLKLSLPRSHQTEMTPDTFSNSTFSSPDFNHSQCSFDTPRLGTAASSMTDRTCPSFFTFGEPGPEFRISVDDVPSLTSSRSTMTSPPQHPYGPTFSRPHDERSGSISSTPGFMDRRRSRSSIASLSRLMGGSFGERSKLSIEQRPVSEHIPSTRDIKPKKSKRLSKLIHFWKPKDSSHA